MRWTLLGKIVGDLVLVNIGFLAAFLVRFGGKLPQVNWLAYSNLIPWITLIAFILLYSYDLYIPGRKRWDEIFSSLICVVAILFITTLAISFLFHQFAFPRSIFILAVPFQLLFLGLWRRFIWAWSLKHMGPLTLIVVGPKEGAEERARMLLSESTDRYRIAGLIVDRHEQDRGESTFPILGCYGDIVQILKGFKGGGVLFCSDIPPVKRITMMNAVLRNNLSIFAVPDIYEIFIAQAQLEHLDGIPVFRLSGFTRKPVEAWKRLMDIALAVFFGVIALPLVLLAAIAIKIESPGGPVLFRQERVGQGGKVFELLKLRTMIPNAEMLTGPVLAEENDSRITKVGKVLRASRIDELPQLWNVLKGDMSFVGPRPERPVFVQQFRDEMPGYELRHQVKTGITGLAQVEGKYTTPPEDKLRFDLLYVKTMSPIKDIQILLHTLKVMLMRHKAS